MHAILAGRDDVPAIMAMPFIALADIAIEGIVIGAARAIAVSPSGLGSARSRRFAGVRNFREGSLGRTP